MSAHEDFKILIGLAASAEETARQKKLDPVVGGDEDRNCCSLQTVRGSGACLDTLPPIQKSVLNGENQGVKSPSHTVPNAGLIKQRHLVSHFRGNTGPHSYFSIQDPFPVLLSPGSFRRPLAVRLGLTPDFIRRPGQCVERDFIITENWFHSGRASECPILRPSVFSTILCQKARFGIL